MRSPEKRPPAGFTLVELLVSMVVITLLGYIVMAMTDSTARLTRTSAAKIGSFQEARNAFEAMTRQLSQATLNTYWDYDSLTAPKDYVRQSELHLRSGLTTGLLTPASQTWSGEDDPVRPGHAVFFQAPLGRLGPAQPGLERLLVACGYYIEFNSDRLAAPVFLRNRPSEQLRWRYRLMQLQEPAVNMAVYLFPASQGAPGYNSWFNLAVAQQRVRPVAENIVALVLLPKRSPADGGNLSPDYGYDSRTVGTGPPQSWQRHQLPPMYEVTMVAIDELSAQRLAARNGKSAPDLIQAGWFKNAAQYSSGDPAQPKDLENLTAELVEQGVSYRVFSTQVSLRGAKWSQDK